MADKPFPAYGGDGPYFFVTYAHDDSETIYPQMAWIREAGFNLWYDDGIHIGTVWRRALADALSASSGVIFFCTARSVDSDNCLKEINFALDDAKPIFVVQLDDTPLPGELRLSLSDRQALVRSEFEDATYRERLVSALGTVAEPVIAAAAPTAVDQRPRKTELPALAVLPFQSLSDDRELAFVAEGIAGDIIASMSDRLEMITKVPGQPSDVGLEPQEIGIRRGVRYVLSGNLQKGGKRVRATVNLLETSGGSQVWAQRYDHSSEDLLEVQDELVASIMNDIGPALGTAERARLASLPEEDLDAWGLMHRATAIVVVDRTTRDRVFSLLHRAVALDPNFGPVHAILSARTSELVQTQFSSDPERDARDALGHADRALQLMPNHPWALCECAMVNLSFGSAAYALRLAERATEIGGRDFPPLYWALIQNGRSEEVVERASRGSAPALNVLRVLYTACVCTDRYEQALEWAEKQVANAPPQAWVLWAELANVLGHLDRRDEAMDAVNKAKSVVPRWTFALWEKGTRVRWNNNEAVVEPQVAGLRKLGIE